MTKLDIVENFIESEGKPHPQVTVRIGDDDVLIDQELSRLVPLLNCFPGYSTVSSCQGYPFDEEASRWDGHVAIRYYDNRYEGICQLGFGILAPLMDKADTWHSISQNNESPITLWIVFPQECIPAIEAETRKILEAMFIEVPA